MFKKIKEFLFGKPEIIEAPYKIEPPTKEKHSVAEWRIENAVSEVAVKKKASQPARKRRKKPSVKKP